MRLSLIKTMGGLFAPYDDESKKQLARLKVGQLIGGDFAAARNYMFHRRFFALMQLGFDIWSETVEPMEYMGERVHPNLENFRHEIVILAGYYETYVSIKGEVRLQAKSISFARMDETEFEAVYSSCIQVILSRCFAGSMSEKDIRARVEQVLSFDN